MKEHQIQIRVRYSETDQMSVVYHGNYMPYFEMGRVEALRKLGIPYSEWEAQGILLPVVSLSTRFLLPLRYDEVVTMKTTFTELTRATLFFDYELYNESKQLTTTAQVTLVCLDANRKKPRSVPDSLPQSLKPYEIETL